MWSAKVISDAEAVYGMILILLWNKENYFYGKRIHMALSVEHIMHSNCQPLV